MAQNLERRLARLPSVRRRIGQALALCTHERAIRTLFIVDPKFGAVFEPEIKFGEIAVETLFINVLVDANQPTLEHREEAFKGVGVHVVADVFAFGMIDEFVLPIWHDFFR